MPVLVVDGHAAVRHGLESYLAALGAEPLSAVDADEALALLRRRLISHQPCRLVLADAELPDNGADRLPAAIAGDPQLGKPMLALLKPAGQSADIESENQYPLTVAKPVSLDKLMQALEQTLEHPPASEEETDTPSDALPPSPTVPGDVEVLLVEDQAANRRVAQRMLQRMGIQVICAENGREAVQMFQQHRFSLIFMDMQMPEMDGLEATRRIRELEQRHDGSPSHTPIIAMTANAMESDRHTCLHAGMDDHLPKPISFEQVEEQLERWISDYSPSQGA